MDLSKVIRTIPDFPKEGIVFRDITPILSDAECLEQSITQIAALTNGLNFSKVAGPESRGFIFGVPTAVMLKKGFIPIRKAGKLPYKTIKKSYALEYGTAVIEIHEDAIEKGERIVIIDDLLATGGTSKAAIELIESAGGIVEAAIFLIELQELKGRELLNGYNIMSLLKY